MEDLETVILKRKTGESETDFLQRYFGSIEEAPGELGEPDEQYIIVMEEKVHD